MTGAEKPSWRRRAVRRVWTVRTELALAAAVVATGGVALLVPATRRLVVQGFRHARTRRRLVATFGHLKLANSDGRMPRIRRIEAMPFGERVHLRLRGGLWRDVFDVRAKAFAVGQRAQAVRIDEDPADASKIILDMVRRDPLAAVGDVAWRGLDQPVLSMWDDIHVGTTEMGDDLPLNLAYRAVIVGGRPGAGKSTFLKVLTAHVARCPDAHLLIVDPNKQFAQWRDRALAYAANDPQDAARLLAMLQAEVDRRLDWLATLPGAPEKLTREIAAAYNVPLWVAILDELAYHTSVAGTGDSRAAFGGRLRDIVARARAAGIIVVVATQRPTDKVVPRDLSDLFSIRVAFNVLNAGNSDVILGDGWAKKGYDASEIKIESCGQGFLLADGGKPVSFKSARISPADLADLSVTTIPLKPRPVTAPELRLVSDAAA